MDDKERFTPSKTEVINILSRNVSALATLMRIVSIEESYEIPTLGVPLEGPPKILYNPDFVQEHCNSNAHFAMAVLHELYHILLGHTFFMRAKTFGDVSQKTLNIAFDAMINATICMQYPSTTFQSFFTNFYDKAKMPQALLRPRSRPARFWERKRYKQLYTLVGLPPEATIEIIEQYEKETSGVQLLGNHNGGFFDDSGNSNIPDALLDRVAQEIMDNISGDLNRIASEKKWKAQRRLNHKQYELNRKKYQTDISKDEIEKLKKEVKKLKQELDEIRNTPGYSLSAFGSILGERIEAIKQKKALEEELTKVASQSSYSKIESQIKSLFPKIPEKSVIPNFRNRKAIVSLTAGIYQPFYMNPLRPKDFGQITLYIDVSGSMDQYMSTIYKVTAGCSEYLNDDIYVFSNKVAKITKEDLLHGKVISTGGTDDCFLDHALENNFSKIMVFTDGFLKIKQKNIEEVAKRNMKILTVYTPGFSDRSLKKITMSSIVMNEEGQLNKR